MITNLKCQICNQECSGFKGLGTHIIRIHKISTKEYYDNFSKSETNGICKSCKKTTGFKSLSEGYRTTCSPKCAQRLATTAEAKEKYKQTCMKKYGVENAASLDWVKKKNSDTHFQIMASPIKRKQISIATKKAMQREDVKQNHLVAVQRPKSEETIQKISDAAKRRYIDDPTLRTKIYTEARNDKVSDAKIKYWKKHPEAKNRVANIWKLWKARDENGWRKHLLKASQLGFKKIFSTNGETKLEEKMYSFMNARGINYIKQYELEYKLYDAYLPDHNVLLEFDGEFWHKKSLNECTYPFQKTSYYNDTIKDEIAKRHGIPLFRIREHESPEKILECIKK